MPLPADLRRQIDLQTLRDFAAELRRSLDSSTLDEVGRQSCEYHLRLARDSIATLEQRQAPNRPAPRFQTEQAVWTPGETKGAVIGRTWIDGSWVYQISFAPRTRLVRSYAEHELTEASR